MDSPPKSDPIAAASPAEVDAKREERVHKTKVIQFLGRKTPVILQNDNGPCPLLAICNVLSLKNILNLSPDIAEVSQEKLLSLVAERLIDSNSNIDNKDAGYLENQQQNISDAIDLLPRLTTGIDVNIKFRRIDDFEFTPECAIFDLLDIPLYHGWIVDPQDHETADAIDSKSYNALMGELVSLETQILDHEQEKGTEDDIDFVAATTAALGVPSPSLSRGQSFDESPHKARKGDIEEEEMLLRALKLSETETRNSVTDGVSNNVNLSENMTVNKPELITHLENVVEDVSKGTVNAVIFIPEVANAPNHHNMDTIFPEIVSHEISFPVPKPGQEISLIQPFHEGPQKSSDSVGFGAGTENKNGKAPSLPLQHELSFGDNVGFGAGTENKNGKVPSLPLQHELSFGLDIPQDLRGSCAEDNSEDTLRGDEDTQNEVITTSEPYEPRQSQDYCKEKDKTRMLDNPTVSDSANGQIHNTDDPGTISSPVDHSEPIYEGEECILVSGTPVFDDQEPVYEGEAVLAEQVDRVCMNDDGSPDGKEKLSSKQGEIIRNFLKISASQLTTYGLFCLQDKVKERELCVFFRNNHFNTMFKHKGELYILVTDQGYINQPDLVWEKLNEVNGDTVYMTGDFKEFKMDDLSESMWNEKNPMDYMAGVDGTQASSTYTSDLELAMALQQQEFEHQQNEQQQHERNIRQQSISDSSKLVTGPQASNSSGGSVKQESPKSKEKCIVM